MIFVTVGTHEQSFNRLIEKIDMLKRDGVIKEDVVIQRGYSTYKPTSCEYYDLIPWEKMQEYNKNARIIITHGGPASFIDILSLGKKPIIVPRQKIFNEHVNNHQLDFCRELVKRGLDIYLVEDINILEDVILNYTNTGDNFNSNNVYFVEQIIKNIKELF